VPLGAVRYEADQEGSAAGVIGGRRAGAAIEAGHGQGAPPGEVSTAAAPLENAHVFGGKKWGISSLSEIML
jgi:hypothetical protein